MANSIDTLMGNITPTVENANSDQVQGLIDQNNANSQQYNTTGQGLQDSSNNYVNQAGQSINNTQGNIDQAQGAINTANQYATGGNMNQSLDYLQQQAAGTAPTAATGMMQQGTDQALQSQMAMANSGNANNMVSGQKNAMNNAATIQQTAANNASQIAANQQMQGSQAYANAAAQQAAQLGNNAQLQQGQTAAQQQQSQLYSNLANQQQQGALGYGNLTNQAQANALNGQTNIYNTQQGVNNQQQQTSAQMEGGLMNAAGGAVAMIPGISSYDAKDNVSYGSGPYAGKKASLLDLVGDKKDDSSFTQDKAPSRLTLDGRDKSQQPTMPIKPEGNTKPTYAPSTAFSGMGQGKLGAVGNQYPLASDEHSKKDIKEGENKIKSFLDAIDPVTFDYKKQDGVMGKTPGKHLGVIAQQLERAPNGASLVINTSQGKGIDIPSAVGALLASVAELNDRIEDYKSHFESKKKRKAKK